jgi:hypothetical protein
MTLLSVGERKTKGGEEEEEEEVVGKTTGVDVSVVMPGRWGVESDSRVCPALIVRRMSSQGSGRGSIRRGFGREISRRT